MIRRGDRSHGAVDSSAVLARLDALNHALTLGGDRLEPRARQEAERVIRRSGERMAHGAENTVVALAGATGSGKSSLFNAVVGEQVAQPGARRPTTSTPTSVAFDGTAAGLLDWLDVGTRHQLEPDPAWEHDPSVDLSPLVLLDLPDHDSTVVAHQETVDRMVGLVDLLVWVVDPQKYADDALHTRYLQPLVGHQGVMLVVLNQVDRLPSDVVEDVTADLRRLLAAEGLTEVTVLATSAVTGQGVPELRQAIATAVARHDVMLRRVAADLDRAAAGLQASVGATEVDPQRVPGRDRLVGALASAAGAPVVSEAVHAGYLRQARGATGWPFTRWTRGLRPDPLRRVGLGQRAATAEIDPQLARTSLPEPSRAQRAEVDLALRTLSREAGQGLPDRWLLAVREASDPGRSELTDRLDQAVAGIELETRRPVWWGVVGFVQLVLAIVAVVGLLWLAAMFAATAWLAIPNVPTPRWHGIPYPTMLFVGGLVLGLALAALARVFAGVGAARRRRRVDRQVQDAVAQVADRRVMDPVREVLSEHRLTREAVAEATGGGAKR